LLDGLPPFVKVTDARRFVLELVDQLKAAGQEVNSMRLANIRWPRQVCRHAVKANDPLAGPGWKTSLMICDIRYAIHVPAWAAHPDRNELPGAGKEVRATTMTAAYTLPV